MDTWVWIVIAILVIAVVAGIVWAAMSRRRTATLQEQFGPEYERTMRTSESRRDAENSSRLLTVNNMTPAALLFQEREELSTCASVFLE